MNAKNCDSLKLKCIFSLLLCQFFAYHIRCMYIKKPMSLLYMVLSLQGCSLCIHADPQTYVMNNATLM